MRPLRIWLSEYSAEIKALPTGNRFTRRRSQHASSNGPPVLLMCLSNTYRRTNHEEPSHGAKFCAFIYLVCYFQHSCHCIDLGAGSVWQAIDFDRFGTRELSQSRQEDDALVRFGRRTEGLPKTDR